MAKLIILEGARTTGKSTVAQILRQTLPSSTLINMTGYKDDGFYGKMKILEYYNAFVQYISMLSKEHTIILDRMFISEMVYSNLYKSYDFSYDFDILLNRLFNDGHIIKLFFFQVNEDSIEERLKRDKFDDFSKIGDSVEQIVRQQNEYKSIIKYTKYLFENDDNQFTSLNIYNVNTSHMSIEEVVSFVKERL
jgi:deoxyguanosine kinase